MSKLDKMIAELCPDGVEYKTISELFNTRNGYTPSKAKKEYWINGTIPWFRMEDIRENGRILSKAMQYVSESAVKGSPFPANSIIVATSATIGEHALIKVPSLANQRFTYLMLKDEYKAYIDIMFIYYYCFKLDEYCKVCLNHGNFASVDMRKFAKFKFPVPPLEIQREIVRVLDSFTLLTAELTAELTARKKQYDFYRDKLLTHNKEYPMKPLAELGKWAGGKTPAMAEKSFWEGGTIPWISSKDMKVSTLTDTQDHITEKAINEASMTLFPENSIAIVTRSGILKHTFPVAYVPFKTTINQDIKILVVNKWVLPRYAFHVIQGKGQDILTKTKKQGGTVDSLDFQKVLAYKVPVPPLDVQERLVQVLDNFECICTDLNIGLPAEIEARQKQYEYYRDLLLTFAETGSTLVTDRQTDRQTELNAIRLIQYVFGYATIPLVYISDFRNGKGHEKNIVNNGKYIVVNAKFISTDGQIKKYSNKQICPLYKNDILMVMSDLPNGRALAKCFLVDEDDKFTLNQRIGAFTVRRHDLINTKYLYYVLNRNSQLLKYDNGADQTNLRKNEILNILIPVPSIEEQQRIVNILDRFDTLCNDLSEGLPAEIEARRKQYEYYRDKLLSFEEIQKK